MRWSFPSWNAVTGVQLSEHLPFTNVSFQQELMGGGAMTGTIPVAHPAIDTDMRNWVGKIVTAPCKDGVPFGVFLWQKIPGTGLASTVQQIQMTDAITDAFTDRRILHDLEYTQQMDVRVAADLFRYGLNQGTVYADTNRQSGVTNSGLPWLTIGDGTSANLVDRTKVVDGQEDDGYRAKNRKPILDAVMDLADNEGGFEFIPRFNIDPVTGGVIARVEFGSPTVGTPPDYADRIAFEYPGGNIVDGSYGVDATQYATRVDVIGGTTGTTVAIGSAVSARMNAAGFPAKVRTLSENNIVDTNNLRAKATGEVTRRGKIVDGFTLVLDGNTDPFLGTYGIGDWVTLRIERGQSGVLQELAYRIIGWKIDVDDTGDSEKVTPVFADLS